MPDPDGLSSAGAPESAPRPSPAREAARLDSDAQAAPRVGIRSLAFAEPGLTAAAVEQLERVLRAERDVRPVLLDCRALTHVTPGGLTALLELGRSASGLRELALATLSRPLLLAAIQAGLAERFTIYVNAEAGARCLAGPETTPCEP